MAEDDDSGAPKKRHGKIVATVVFIVWAFICVAAVAWLIVRDPGPNTQEQIDELSVKVEENRQQIEELSPQRIQELLVVIYLRFECDRVLAEAFDPHSDDVEICEGIRRRLEVEVNPS